MTISVRMGKVAFIRVIWLALLICTKSYFSFRCIHTFPKHVMTGSKGVYQRKESVLFSTKPEAQVTEKKTFKRFMQIELWRQPELESLFPILCSLELACRDINRLMRRVSTDNLEGGSATMNIQGEDQKKLDVIANRIMKVALCCSGKLSAVASEEEDELCLCSTVTDNAAFSGEYAAVFDPLDGSSNIDSGLPTGSIFGVYKAPRYGTNRTEPLSIVRQKGSELVVAGYCLYSASCHLVITMRTGVHMFTLDDVSGEFYLTRSNVRVPRSGGIYAFNDAYSEGWPAYVNYFISEHKSMAYKKPSARYMGALVADTHNILLNGKFILHAYFRLICDNFIVDSTRIPISLHLIFEYLCRRHIWVPRDQRQAGREAATAIRGESDRASLRRGRWIRLQRSGQDPRYSRCRYSPTHTFLCRQRR